MTETLQPYRIHEWVAETLGERPTAWRQVLGREENTVHRLTLTGGECVYLKVSAEDLTAERDRLTWFAGRIPIPEVRGWHAFDDVECLLTTELPGEDLTRHLARPLDVVRLLARALRRIHSLDPDDCPFGTAAPDSAVTHGDACLPNILIDGLAVTGYIDLGDAGLAPPEVDLAAALWSLDHNFGDGDRLGRAFLAEYGLPELSDAEIRRLRDSY
ncbi:phosphotransferase [Rhizohabitans arisaemae]|uniref:phosphotransferase n=1 Tax=Rhizohabitans arisaemae TaxID=2720610 RepID=UPI0024B1D3D8|nr:phosphotransferase [Rhizohabitans arisaemae]